MSSVLAKVDSSMADEEEALSALIAYEDSVTRDRAMRMCDRLVEKFWKDFEFDISWWRFDFLRDAELAQAAASTAARSDLVLISAHGGRELPAAVSHWIETWVARRGPRSGILAAMIGTGEDPFKGLTPIHVFLREAAQRANMDYLPQSMDAPLNKLDGSIETITTRAEKVTSLLDNILHRPTLPLHWGINE